MIDAIGALKPSIYAQNATVGCLSLIVRQSLALFQIMFKLP